MKTTKPLPEDISAILEVIPPDLMDRFVKVIDNKLTEEEKRMERRKCKGRWDEDDDEDCRLIEENDPRKLFTHREFLNQPHKESPAAIQIVCNDDEYNLLISDCGGRARLHGSMRQKESVENALYKCERLLEGVNKFADFLKEHLKGGSK